jgi:hypothetical protein
MAPRRARSATILRATGEPKRGGGRRDPRRRVAGPPSIAEAGEGSTGPGLLEARDAYFREPPFREKPAPQAQRFEARRLAEWLVARVVVTDEEIEILDVRSRPRACENDLS